MDQNNRPRGREKNVTGTGKGVERKGSGLGTGPVGGSGGNICGGGVILKLHIAGCGNRRRQRDFRLLLGAAAREQGHGHDQNK